MTIDKLNDDGCLNILEALLENTAIEFAKAYCEYISNPNDEYSSEVYNMHRDFILSEYFGQLTGLDGNEIVRSLEHLLHKEEGSVWQNFLKWMMERGSILKP